MSARSHYESKLRSKQRQRALARRGTNAQMGDVLDDLVDAVSNLRDAWPVIGEVWADRQKEVFATESHGRWAPLAPDTLIAKRHNAISMDTLVQTGALFQAVTSSTPRAQGDRFAVYGPPKGADIDYAMNHALGRGGPQRNPVPRMTAPEMNNVVELIRDYFRPDWAPKKGKPLTTELKMRLG